VTKYLWEKFTVPMGGDEQYRANWEVIFGKKPKVCAAEKPCPCANGETFSECHGKAESDPADA
jgi:hypothetical protein